MQRGINAYSVSDYGGAMSYFSRIDEGSLNEKGRVRLFVYRGLSRFNIGDRAGAMQDLTTGRALYQSGEPKWLPPHIVQQMDDALAQLGAGGAAPPPGPPHGPPAGPPPGPAPGPQPAPTAGGSQYLPPQPK